ncbi:7-cyano-7-deazaguanine synthase QueC [Acanthopleuribacter pedis]|uniref:7-cyano-7-deazaguanine synthase n=1 Tax=Acanthopleuribacter pedis TaxID=442870 RepID=A0A8J7U5R9_9BACT|nr:7-cyano-7-deazaguanine synthase QueC [Acanthopleuribacter pedis]
MTTAIAAQDYEVALLHVQYGQKTAVRELRAFQAIADHYGVGERLVTNLNHLRQIGGSSLTDDRIAVSEVDLTAEGIPSSYVPFRNAHLLSIATSWAEVIGASRIFLGAVEEDSSGYPDCRISFIEAFNRVIEQGTKPETEVRIETPLISLSKQEIVMRGSALKAPLALSWSCYQNVDKACGVCDSCALRLRGFARAGLADPIAYEDDAFRRRYT